MTDEKKSRVVNVKVVYIQPTYQNLKEWMADEQNVYIGHAGIVFINKERFPKKSSIWANPFKISKYVTRENVVARYEEYIRKKLKDPNMIDQLIKLKGKNLGCWCHPELCHGDVLISLISEFDK